MEDYEELLLPGEKWHPHIFASLSEIYECISIFKISGRLPNCFWEDIACMHATNFSTLYNMTSRYINMFHPDTVCIIKPTISFLNWIYINLLENKSQP